MKGVFAPIRDALQALGGGATWTAVLVLVGIGAVCMAIVQVIKELTPLRRSYQQQWIARWIAVRAHADFPHPDGGDCPGCRVEVALVEIATGGERNALYELAVDAMSDQINAAAQVTLDDPKRYEPLLKVLAFHASASDLDVVIAGQPKSDATQSYFEARGRVSRRIQRNLDGIKLALGSRWKFLMQALSITLTVILVESAVAIYHPPVTNWEVYFAALPVGIVGGYFAPIAKDLLAVLQNLRNP